MNATLLVATYVIAWTISLFIVLPIGVETVREPSPLHDPGAPKRSNIGRKMVWAALMAAIITAIIGYVSNSGWISFR